MGVQGAGKGEQAKYITEDFNIPHISTGDLFRAMKDKTDALALRIQETTKQGRLVSDEETNEVLLERLNNSDTVNGFILDGYPRNQAQAEWLDEYLHSKNEKLTIALLLDLDLYVAFKRSFGRITSKQKKSYNIYYNPTGIKYEFIEYPASFFPPRLEAMELETNTPLTRRPDDANAAAIVSRIDSFVTETQPLIPYYQQQGVLHRIQAERSIEDVRLDILVAIDNVFRKKDV